MITKYFQDIKMEMCLSKIPLISAFKPRYKLLHIG